MARRRPANNRGIKRKSAFEKTYFINRDIDPKKRALMTHEELLAFESTMPRKEQMEIIRKSNELFRAGDRKGWFELSKKLPLPPFVAWNMKIDDGKEELLEGGFNLKDADKYYGEGWIDL